MPFIGDGDIAAGGTKQEALKHEVYGYPGLYIDRFVYGADLDGDRVSVARKRIPNGDIRVADCDSWPFSDQDTGPIAVADFDAWNEPWPSFRSFWGHAQKADRMVLFFTDAHRMGIAVDGTLIYPDGTKKSFEPGVDRVERSKAFNFYLAQIVWPWFNDHIKPYRMIDKSFFLRGMLTYWGAVIELKENSDGKRKAR